MSNLYWLNEDQMVWLRPYFSKSHGVLRVDDRRVLSGIILINRNGLRWRDAPREYGPAKTLYNRWKRWRDMGVFARIMEGLAAEAPASEIISIDATYLKAHRAGPVPFFCAAPSARLGYLPFESDWAFLARC